MAPAAHAALANGASGHAMDYDDTQLSTTPDRTFGLLTHPDRAGAGRGAGGRRAEGRLGRGVSRGVPDGFEVECKIAEAIDPDHYKRGFHSSGTIGTFGAAAVRREAAEARTGGGRPHADDRVERRAGIRVNFGSMTKPLHVGRAAENGVVRRGAGVARLHRRRRRARRPVGLLPGVRRRRGCSTGSSPCSASPTPSSTRACRSSRIRAARSAIRRMDAMLKLVTDHDVKPEQIKAVRVRAGSNILEPLRYKTAKTELEAQVLSAVPDVEHHPAAQGRHPRVHRRVRVERAGAADDAARHERVRRRRSRRRASTRCAAWSRSISTDGRTLVQASDDAIAAGRISRSRGRSFTRSSPTARRSRFRKSACSRRSRKSKASTR